MNIMPTDREKRWKQITDRFGISGAEPDTKTSDLESGLSAVLPENLAGVFKAKLEGSKNKKGNSSAGKK